MSREAILQRLDDLLATVPGITAVYRDRGDLPIEKLPACVLLDGSEVLVSEIFNQKMVRMPPAIFVLRPQIFVVTKPRDDLTNLTLDGDSAPVGPELSAWRDAVLNAVINDSTLVSLVGTTGQITYRGCDTDMQTGSSMVGQLQMHFDFYYVLQPPRG